MYESFSEEILTVEEFAELLYIGRNTAYRILNSGEIRAFKIGKSWKIPKDAVSEYILRKSRRNLSDNWNDIRFRRKMKFHAALYLSMQVNTNE